MDTLHNDHPRRLQSRAELRDLLVSGGLPRAAAEKVATAGWPAISPAAEADTVAVIRAATEQMLRLK